MDTATDDIRIERLGHRGDGIAPGPVYAPRTLPGEIVRGPRDGDRIPAPEVVAPSPDRVAPPCPHYDACGGCALQHASDRFVAGWKVASVRRALAAQGIDARPQGIATSPAGSRRRATLSGRRTKSGALVGFHARASDSITEIPDCHLLAPALMAGLPAARDLVIAGGSRKAELSLTLTASEAGLDVAVAGGRPLDTPLRATLAQVAAGHDLARLTWEGETIAAARPAWQAMGRARVDPPPGAFLQATPQGERALVASVRQAVGEAARVVDLFAGCGTFALPLAAGAEVHAVEGSAPMLAALDRGWRQATGLRRVTTEARDLFRRPLTGDELTRFDAAVIDPPRAGAEAQTRALAEAGVPVIAFVSCDPATFARDAAILTAAGYALDMLRVVDQFRWSTHVEIAARFTRA